MSDLDDLLDTISDRGERRDTRFELSTVRDVIRLLGAPKAEVDNLHRDLSTGLDWEWFNALDIIEPVVGSARDFQFSFEEFFTKPHRHEVVKAAWEWVAAEFCAPEDPWLYIFNVYGHGRMAATNLVQKPHTHIHVVTPQGQLNILTLKDALEPYAGAWVPQ